MTSRARISCRQSSAKKASSSGLNCASKYDCHPTDHAYEIYAETFGEVGRLDRPRLTLYMVAATSDEYKAKRKSLPDNPSYKTPQRPALKGHVPPPYKIGRDIFDRVLNRFEFDLALFDEVPFQTKNRRQRRNDTAPLRLVNCFCGKLC